MAYACGVDFGTSNSTVACLKNSQPILLALEEDKFTLPSVIFFNTDLDQTTYGRAALAAYLEGYEGRLMRSMKSLLGTSLLDGHTEVDGRRLGYQDLLIQYIAELKSRAQQAAGQEFVHAVFGRPVHFIDDNPAADQKAEHSLREIAHAVGFKEITFQLEPIAAALDYESSLVQEELVLVVDIGGGTSDFSVLRLSPQRRNQVERQEDILSNAGVHIGGTDFDKYLSLRHLMPLLGMNGQLRNGSTMPSTHYFNLATWHTINLAYTQKVQREVADLMREVESPSLRHQCACLQNLLEQKDGHWLAMKAEQAKIALTEVPSTTLELERFCNKNEKNRTHTVEISNASFLVSIAHLLQEMQQTVSLVLKQALVSPDQIDTIYFTGGASGVRGLRQYLTQILPHARQVNGDVFGSIGSGLAWEAHRRYG
ncbi:MAG: Hsp70 family protein [Undibacterium sp.]|nr:Hsp70 family protein [Undibacterium sp.]